MSTSSLDVGRPISDLLVPPRVLWHPDFTIGSLADDVVDLMAGLRRPLDDWQEMGVRTILGQTDEQVWHAEAQKMQQRFAANKCGCWVPRQNGKGDILMAGTLGWMFFLKEPLTIHSAHEYKTAQEAYLRLRNFCRQHDTLDRKVQRYWQGNGEQGIELTIGAGAARLRYMARTGKSGRGFSSGKVILDEAQELTLEQIKAILFVVSAQPNWQIVFAGTPPSDPDAWIYDLREQGETRAEDTAWMDWGMDWVDPTSDRFVEILNDRETWAATNPAYPHRVTDKTIAGELRLLKATTAFAMERCGMWLPKKKDDEAATHPLLPGRWQAAATKNPTDILRPDRVALAFHVNTSRTHMTIGYAGMIGGRWRVGVIRHQTGTAALIPALVDLRDRIDPVAIVVDTKSESTIKDLAEYGIRPPESVTEPKLGDLLQPTAGAVAAAFGLLVDAVNNGQLDHHDEPPLNVAVTAPTRALAGGSTWDHKSGIEVGPAICAGLAMWGYREMQGVQVEPDYDPLANIW